MRHINLLQWGPQHLSATSNGNFIALLVDWKCARRKLSYISLIFQASCLTYTVSGVIYLVWPSSIVAAKVKVADFWQPLAFSLHISAPFICHTFRSYLFLIVCLFAWIMCVKIWFSHSTSNLINGRDRFQSPLWICVKSNLGHWGTNQSKKSSKVHERL